MRFFLLVLLLAMTLMACNSEESQVAGSEPTEIPKAEIQVPSESVTPIDNNKLIAQLSAADQLDGETDKTVHKCAGCALGMDGKEEHAIKVDEYSMHFCSAYCKNEFEPEAKEKVLALTIPVTAGN